MNLNTYASVISHALIGFYFIFFSIWNIYHWSPMIQVMIRKNIPSPLFLLSIAISLQMIGGFMIGFKFLVPLASLVLIPFVIFLVFILHPFWEFHGELRKQHMALFITNFTMCIGALVALTRL